MFDNKAILESAKQIAADHADLFGDDAEKINEIIKQTSLNDTESVRQSANKILDLLTKHPQALTSVLKKNGNGEESDSLTTKGYQPPPGDSGAIAPGTKLVCPEPGCSYSRRLRQKGQRLFCPECEKQLVPENQKS